MAAAVIHTAAAAADAAIHVAPQLDAQVLHGLETFVATERFLSKLEQARAEWVEVSRHAHGAAGAASAAAHALHPAPFHPLASSSAAAAAAAAEGVQAHPMAAGSDDGHHHDEDDEAAYAAARRDAATTSGSGGSGGGDNTSAADADAAEPPAPADAAAAAAAADELLRASDPDAAAAAAAALGDFVVVSRDDAVEAMAYYIAAYISRLPEAQRMGPKELQAALKEAFATMRSSRWRLVWGWGRLLYRSAAVSFSALQLYQNPWLLRAVLSALWASSRVLYAQFV